MSGRLRRWPLVAMAVVFMVAATVQTASNTVAPTKVEDDTRAITPNDLKPVDCVAISLGFKLSGTGTIAGNANAQLITGSAVVDTITGAGGSDCILGGAGNDSLNGGTQIDVCIGGPGTDTFNVNCETQIQ